MTELPVRADPEVAAATFADHLDRALTSPVGVRSRWSATWVNPLEVVVHMPATRQDGTEDTYHLRLRAYWYDQWPPDAAFVVPPSDGSTEWRLPSDQSRWLPRIVNRPDGSFAFHTHYSFTDDAKRQYPDATLDQLICCSMSFGYYISGHEPTPGQRWTQGRHTVAALLSRVQAMLHAPHYEGSAGDLDT